MSGSVFNQLPARNTTFQNSDGLVSPVWWNFMFRQWKIIGGGTFSGSITDLVLKAGDTMTGFLTLAGNPVLGLHAAPKQYVDLSLAPVSAAAAAAQATADAALPKSGGTMIGAIVLPGNPTLALQAAPKQYVDASVVAPSATTPSPVGVAAVGVGTTYARADHVHALNTLATPPTASLTAIVATTETALWTPATYTPIAANLSTVGKIYRVTAGGIMSFAATGTLTITPRFGLSVGAGITMGASVAQTTPGVTTNQPWRLQMDIVVRTGGATGTVIGAGTFTTNATGTAGTAVSIAFGGTQATVDLTVATGICIGWTLSVAGTVTPQYAFIEALN